MVMLVMLEKVLGVAMLGRRLLGGRGLHAAGVGMAEREVPGGGASTGGVLGAAGRKAGHRHTIAHQP